MTEARGKLRVHGARYEFTQAAIGFAGGGSAAGDVTVEGLRAEAKLAVSRIDLATWHSKLRPTQLEGQITAHGTREAQRFEVKLAEPRFEIAGRATIENRRLAVEEARVARGTSVALVRGAMQLDGRREFELTGTLEHLDPSVFAAQAPAGDINGKLTAKGTLSPALAGEAAVELEPSRLAELALAGRAALAGDTKRLARVDVDLALADARLKARGAFGGTGDALDVELAAPNLAPIGRALGQQLAGSLNAEARATGTFASPAGKVNATAAKLELPGGISLATATARVEVGAEADSRVDGAIEVTGLTRRVAAAPPELLASRAQATITGTRSQHRATLDATLPPERAIEGLLTATSTPARDRRLRVTLQGGLEAKAATPTWKGRIESASVTGSNPVSLAAPATLTLARDLVEIGDARLKGDYGDAHLALTRWTPARIELRGTSEGLLTRPIVRVLGLPANPRSNLVLAAEWDLKATETLEGFLRAKRVRGDVRLGDPPTALGIEELTATIEAARGEVNAALTLSGTQVGKLSARATTQLRRDGDAWKIPKEAALAGEIAADMPTLGWASDWLGPDASVQGSLKGKVALGGTLGSPTWRGNVAVEGVQLREPGLGFEIDNGRAALVLNDREVVIERFELASAWRPSRRADRRLDSVERPTTGTITATGRIDFASRTGSIVLKAQSYPVSQHPSRFIAATGEAKVEAREGGLSIVGALKADAGWFGIAEVAPPTLSEDVMIDRGGELQPATARDRQRLTLDLRFSLGENLYFSGRGLATRLAGEVRLRGEPGRSLLATGSIRTDGGTYDAYGQKLAIERGVLNFQGPLDNPGLNVLAVRPGLPVIAGVEILGYVGAPQRAPLFAARRARPREAFLAGAGPRTGGCLRRRCGDALRGGQRAARRQSGEPPRAARARLRRVQPRTRRFDERARHDAAEHGGGEDGRDRGRRSPARRQAAHEGPLRLLPAEPRRRGGDPALHLPDHAEAAVAVDRRRQARHGRRVQVHVRLGKDAMTLREGFIGTVGNTPLIRLARLSEETGCEILGKAEFLNPGGSVKDRAALWIVRDAEARGTLKPGGTVVEGTAGNTGIGLAHICAARGYKCVIVIPDNQSQEKMDLLRVLGAEVRPVPPKPYVDDGNYQKIAGRLATELPNAIWAQQFDNVVNRRAHYESTGPEIWNDTRREGRCVRERRGYGRHARRYRAVPQGEEARRAHRSRRPAGQRALQLEEDR